jgi:hypothetical protein
VVVGGRAVGVVGFVSADFGGGASGFLGEALMRGAVVAFRSVVA